MCYVRILGPVVCAMLDIGSYGVCYVRILGPMVCAMLGYWVLWCVLC